MNLKAIITKSGNKLVEGKLHSTKESIKINVPTKILKKFSLAVGDEVLVSQREDEYDLEEIAKRRNELIRPLPRDKSIKTIAANLDFMAIVVSASKPDYTSNLIDRFIIRATKQNITPIIILNKCDQLEDKFNLKNELEKFKYLKIPFFQVSAKETSELFEAEFKRLKSLIHQKTILLWGQSGVGKSTLITLLNDNEIILRTSEIGKVGKGVHTTTWAELIECKNFNLIDSPGIRSFSLSDIPSDELIQFFPDLLEFSNQCNFHDCRHTYNSKGCSFFSKAWEKEIEKNPFLSDRFNNFIKISTEID